MLCSSVRIRTLVFAMLLGAPVLLSQTPSGFSSSAASQQAVQPPLPNAPSASAAPARIPIAKKPPTDDGAYEHLIRGNVSCGAGTTLQSGGIGTAAVAMCGAGVTIIPSVVTELGVTGPESGNPHFYVSEDFVAPLTPTLKRLHGAPLGLIGYTKIVGDSNRLDFGVGWDHHLGNSNSLAFELRDYMEFSAPAVQHTILLRVSLAAGGDWD